MKISVITPVYNGEKYIRQTIDSILMQQGNFELEYIIIDGLSSDDTVRIANRYKTLVDDGFYANHRISTTMQIISEKDNGMYDALVKGFKLCTGDIVAYQNADDFYYVGAFASAVKLFEDLPEVSVFNGRSVITNSDSIIESNFISFVHDNNILLGGALNCGKTHYYVPQESTFWRKELLQYLDYEKLSSLKLAGDFYLWYSFAKHVKFYSADILISSFRKTEGQLSSAIDKYNDEAASLLENGFSDELDNLIRIVYAMKKQKLSYLKNVGLIYLSNHDNKYCYSRLKEIKIFKKNIFTLFDNTDELRVNFGKLTLFKITRSKTYTRYFVLGIRFYKKRNK